MARAKYHPEIDGLRAIAVVLVILYHYRVPGFGGGFVGVDVFFVISGYLITSLILSRLEDGTFDLFEFWERRARRILPALVVVVVFCIIAGWILFIPIDLIRLGQSAFAQSFFASNLHFLRETGYFAAGAELKPLLHTWSLALEEQFYLLFPLLFMAIFRFLNPARGRVIAAIAAASFLVSVWYIENSSKSAFYLLQSRAWELMLGSFLACTPLEFGTRQIREALGWLGLICIGLASFQFDLNTPFPGVAAVLPCAGTAFIIWANKDETTTLGKFLSFHPLVLVGLISYSLYLWHLPFFLFAKYASLQTLSVWFKSGLIAASVIVAFISWKFVEQPIRRKSVLVKRWQVFASSAMALLLIAILGASLATNAGYPSRLPPKALGYALGAVDINPRHKECVTFSSSRIDSDNLCKLGSFKETDLPLLVSWGDSHADVIMPILESMALEFSVTVWHAAKGACVPILGVFHEQPDDCYHMNQSMLSLIERTGAKHVLLVARWSAYALGLEETGSRHALISDKESTVKNPKEAKIVFARGLLRTVKQLQQLGVTVWILKQVPLQRFSPPRRLARASLSDKMGSVLGRPLEEHLRRQSFVNSVFDQLNTKGVHFMDPADVLCDTDNRCRVSQSGRSLYRNQDHLSSFGAGYLEPIFRDMFETIAERQ